MPRHCSFCKNIGHNIRYCDSSLIKDAQTLIFAMVDISTPYEETISQLRKLGLILDIFPTNLTTAMLCRYTKYRASNRNNTGETMYEYLTKMIRTEIEKYGLLTDEEKTNYRTQLITNVRTSLIFTQYLSAGGLDRYLLMHLLITYPELTDMLRVYILREYNRKKNERTWNIKHILCSMNMTTYECPICISDDLPEDNIIQTNCGHTYCVSCIDNLFTNTKYDKTPRCSVCRTDITDVKISNELVYDEISKKWN